MCSTSSQASADSALDSNEPECEQSSSSSSIHSADESSRSTGQLSPATMTSEPLSQAQQTLFAGDSPAKTSASPAKGLDWKARAAACGASCAELLAKYDLATRSWRTSQHCLDGALVEFSETWPRSGMTRSGTAYRLAPLVPLTSETAFGLWPTP